MNVDELLRTAIKQRHLIRLVYQGKDRLVEPHDYGVHKGVVKLLAYQIAGSSSQRLPGWRWMETSGISDVRLLNETFAGGRRTATGKHHQWNEVFARVQPAEEGRINRFRVAKPEYPSVTPDQDLSEADPAKLARAIADLGYPRFAYLRGGSAKNPAEVLLASLSSDDLEVRILEALPWLVAQYHDLDWDWLLLRARQRSISNRLGFVVTLASRIAEANNDRAASRKLQSVLSKLKQSRTTDEDTLCQTSLVKAEREWLRGVRSQDAQFWRLLTDIDLEPSLYES